MGDQKCAFKDLSRLGTIWVNDTNEDSSGSEGIVSYFKGSDAQQVIHVLLSHVGDHYLAGRLDRAIEISDRISKHTLVPNIDALGTALRNYKRIQEAIPEKENRIEKIDPEIKELEEEIKGLKWIIFTGFILERLVNIGNNVYLVTGHYNYEPGSDRGVLTCVNTEFSTKVLFTLAVRTTGRKQFTLGNGASINLPTLEEVSKSEISRKMICEMTATDLRNERSKLEEELVEAKANLSALNDQIKELLK